ncbi:MAG: DEAD/DEAH box helicase [Kiritimatiellia bacterium]|jgi:ATP-dependent RNA helicase RhlE|nr:DEAD/DEAH box helicase [Kiritimatiellia bacterium]
MSFETLGLDAQLLRNIAQQGYTVTTPIQKQAIPAILAGRDVIGLAQTGTGKTAAFVLPVLQRLLVGPRRQLRVLIVGPTRELAEQTKAVLVQLGHKTGLRHVTIYGGVGAGPQVKGVHQGAEIAIACPGRLLDLLSQGKFNLNQVECLVLDEADRMFDMGFLPDIRKILKRLPPRRQILLFSATMPDEIRALANDILRDPVTMQMAHSMPAETVDHALYPVEQNQKTALLLALLKTLGDGSVLVFTRTKHRAKRLATQIAASGYRATSLQGNLSQRARQAALDGFKSGLHQILVATDLAARGIDVANITHVINFDMPTTVDDYTHRIGRTGRAAKTGDAYTFTTSEDGGLIRGIERVLKFQIERRRLDGFTYEAVAETAGARPPARASGQGRPSRRPRVKPAAKPTGGKSAKAPASGGGRRSFGAPKASRRFAR